jgi:translation initiation factor 2 beta subunit (eIF-2beta)/eIF-5
METPCPRCGCPYSSLLGRLGRLFWLRCRACGWDHPIDIADLPDADTADADEEE